LGSRAAEADQVAEGVDYGGRWTVAHVRVARCSDWRCTWAAEQWLVGLVLQLLLRVVLCVLLLARCCWIVDL
jgi:hypothetical protein